MLWGKLPAWARGEDEELAEDVRLCLSCPFC